MPTLIETIKIILRDIDIVDKHAIIHVLGQAANELEYLETVVKEYSQSEKFSLR
ncbi:MAG: hypothetical protein JRE18_12500 [Deltaproteobacteria bacterium]|jgi:hypothetical protein|nr:hypothetical protein [Deltaproteobacteria bacterium]